MRNGKIARLPGVVREELDRRLDDGATTDEILAWLNNLPAARTVLEESFCGRPVNHQNISNWRLGGHQEWLEGQQARLAVRKLTKELVCLRRADDGDRLWEEEIGGMYGRVVMQALQNLSREKVGPVKTIRFLNSASRGVVALRQMGQKLERERLVQQGRLAREQREEEVRLARERMAQERCAFRERMARDLEAFRERKRLMTALVTGKLKPGAPDEPPAPANRPSDGMEEKPELPDCEGLFPPPEATGYKPSANARKVPQSAKFQNQITSHEPGPAGADNGSTAAPLPTIEDARWPACSLTVPAEGTSVVPRSSR